MIKVIESWKGLGWKASRAAEFPKEEQSALITRGRQQRSSAVSQSRWRISPFPGKHLDIVKFSEIIESLKLQMIAASHIISMPIVPYKADL